MDDGATPGISAYAMRVRGGRPPLTKFPSSNLIEKVIIERKLKPDDTLAKIALQYSVTVAELKRANNLMTDNDFNALAVVRIPISKLREALDIGVPAASSSSTSSDEVDVDDRRHLLDRDGIARDSSVEEILRKTDANVALVRDALRGTDASESGGQLHFYDARPPTFSLSNYPIWLLIAAVLSLFVVVPLIITYFEEEAQEHHQPSPSTVRKS